LIADEHFAGDMEMLDFETYVTRLGEFGVQAIVEIIERKEGIRYDDALPLEERWNALMRNAASERSDLAA
jgi:hypothetical protein